MRSDPHHLPSAWAARFSATDRTHFSAWCQVSRRMLVATVGDSGVQDPAPAQGCRWHGGKAELDLAQLGSGTEESIPMCWHAPTMSRPPTPTTAA